MCIFTSFFQLPPVGIAFALLVPLIIDGFVQLKTSYESTNPRRVVTGLLFGYGLCSLFLISSKAMFLLGYGLLS